MKSSYWGTKIGAGGKGGLSLFHSKYFSIICICDTSRDYRHHLKEGYGKRTGREDRPREIRPAFTAIASALSNFPLSVRPDEQGPVKGL